MKKVMCTLAAVALILTGCGQSNVLIDDEVGTIENVKYTTENNNPTKPKRQEVKTVTASSETNTVILTETAVSGNKSSETNKITDTGTVQTADTSVPESSTESDSAVVTEENNPVPEITEITESNDPTTTSETSTEPVTEVYYLDGIVYEVHDKYIIINETDFKKMQVSFSDTSMIADINIGDTVEITYNGLINEGNINCAYDAYSIEVTKKSEKKYELESFEYNGVGFSMLVPEGWNNKVIEYPQEGDFTDWGIRFTPDGAVGSMDITWHSSITISGSFDKETVTINNISARKHSRQGIWRFFVFENNYVATNNFFETSQHSDYADDMELMLNTIEFL